MRREEAGREPHRGLGRQPALRPPRPASAARSRARAAPAHGRDEARSPGGIGTPRPGLLAVRERARSRNGSARAPGTPPTAPRSACALRPRAAPGTSNRRRPRCRPARRSAGGTDAGRSCATQEQQAARRAQLGRLRPGGGELRERGKRRLELARADPQQGLVVEDDRQQRRFGQPPHRERPIERDARRRVVLQPELAQPLERPRGPRRSHPARRSGQRPRGSPGSGLARRPSSRCARSPRPTAAAASAPRGRGARPRRSARLRGRRRPARRAGRASLDRRRSRRLRRRLGERPGAERSASGPSSARTMRGGTFRDYRAEPIDAGSRPAYAPRHELFASRHLSTRRRRARWPWSRLLAAAWSPRPQARGAGAGPRATGPPSPLGRRRWCWTSSSATRRAGPCSTCARTRSRSLEEGQRQTIEGFERIETQPPVAPQGAPAARDARLDAPAQPRDARLRPARRDRTTPGAASGRGVPREGAPGQHVRGRVSRGPAAVDGAGLHDTTGPSSRMRWPARPPARTWA